MDLDDDEEEEEGQHPPAPPPPPPAQQNGLSISSKFFQYLNVFFKFIFI